MKRKTIRYYSADDCKCCLYCCIPVIILSFAVENLFKCIYCCPCYVVDLYYNRIKRQINPEPIIIPVAIAIPIDEKTLDRYSGKIWGIN
jgi:hypothetical protein